MEAVVVSAVRTAVAKEAGALRELHAYQFGAAVIREAVRRAGIDPEEIDDVIFGNCFAGGGNFARLALLEAGLPMRVTGLTIDRQCGTGMNAINLAAQAIMAGCGEVYVAGGAESMTRRPYLMARPTKSFQRTPPEFFTPRLSTEAIGNPSMGITAENLAEKYQISREEQDEFAFHSQRKMAKAMREGRFKEQILPLEVPDGKETRLFDTDEHPRETTLEGLAKLKPVFKPGGTVTAGNSSGINDGAAALVLMSRRRAEQLGLQILGTVRAMAVAGVDPNIMGIGPVPTVRKLLKQNGLRIEDIDLIEINEAFAAQVLACDRELHFDPERLNVNGGAIAHGHPIAATGAILATKLLYEMKRTDAKLGLLTACVGGGQGIATLFER
ncbi:thiolase family protein [Polycladomyces subterraneus]|uniref:acetyl-CoA C-acyltransferase n=1 Tax=Polycladomyces subterraneus TaxID=1016997 RepID=A0ABT8IQT4_9BACL|nr:thiolase family protein [Polycladomyces subterraneus]MDN4595158.1 thiolase family protein [Polycladomyces subterraneus]